MRYSAADRFSIWKSLSGVAPMIICVLCPAGTNARSFFLGRTWVMYVVSLRMRARVSLSSAMFSLIWRMGARMCCLLLSGASSARLFCEGSSMFTLMRSARCPSWSMSAGEVPGTAFAWM